MPTAPLPLLLTPQISSESGGGEKALVKTTGLEYNTLYSLIAAVFMYVDLKLEGGRLNPDCYLYVSLLSMLHITQQQNRDDSYYPPQACYEEEGANTSEILEQ